MPSAASFRRAFGLEEGARLASPSSGGWSFVLESVTVGHVEAERHERYLFPTDLRISCEKAPAQKRARSSKAADLSAAAALRGVLEKSLGTHHTAKSAYGSPYDCSFPLGKLRITTEKDGTLIVTAEGRATRRRDIPTSKQQADAKLTAEQRAEIAEAEAKAKQAGLRVVSSRFGTSTCPECQQNIDPGARIARPADAAGKGGWKHVACAV